MTYSSPKTSVLNTICVQGGELGGAHLDHRRCPHPRHHTQDPAPGGPAQGIQEHHYYLILKSGGANISLELLYLQMSLPFKSFRLRHLSPLI